MSHEDHDRLAALLELGDGERPLPPGVEERLLTEVLDTAGAETADADHTDVAVLRAPESTRAPTRRGAIGPWVSVAAVAACLALVVLLRPGTTGPRIDDPGPAASAGPEALSDPELCTATGDAARAANLLARGEAPDLETVHVLDAPYLAGLFAELAARVPADGRPTAAALARVELRLRDTALAPGGVSSVSAQAAYDAVWAEIRDAPDIRRLLTEGCPGGLG